MNNRPPFLDVRSFIMEEASRDLLDRETSAPSSSPFLALYESAEVGMVDPQAEDYVTFVNELYDEEFNEVLSNLVDEAAAIYKTHFPHEHEDPHAVGYQAERLLSQHFAPLAAEAETMFRTLAEELDRRDPNALSQDEIETIVDRYRPSVELALSFEEFLGKLKTLTKKGLNLARQGVSAAAKWGWGPILNKLLALVKPLIKRVIESAINKLPQNLQPIARTLRDKLPFLKELEESEEFVSAAAATYEIAEIQNEFNQQVANLLFAQTEVEQELEVTRALTERGAPDAYPVAELERGRERFVENLGHLKEGEDPTPHLENFIPAILPALRIGIKLAGRKRVVDFLAKFLGKLIQKFVDPQHAPALSQAMVDVGLRLLQMEATPEAESRAAASAVAATVEETVRRVAALPDYILDNQELLEGSALEAFEQAAAANLPPVLSDDTYRKRPELREHRKGFWYRWGRGYKKRIGPRVTTRLSPHKAAALETFEGDSVGEFLEEQLGIARGEEVEALVHLYEAIPGTRLSDIVRGESHIPQVDGGHGQGLLHPLTRDAAALLLGEPESGRDAEPGETGDPYAPQVGQRFYYLEIPGKRPLTVPTPGGRAQVRHRTRSQFVFKFRENKIIVYLFLSEIRAQEIAVKLRQHAHLGVVTARLRRIIERGVRKAFAGNRGRLKLIHEAVTPGQSVDALKRLPSVVPQVLKGRLTEWIVKGLADHLKQRIEEFKKAAEDTADGVTLVITLENPPGLPQLREALKAKVISLASLKLPDGAPTVKIRIIPGYQHE
jgi:hypothetical protein